MKHKSINSRHKFSIQEDMKTNRSILTTGIFLLQEEDRSAVEKEKLPLLRQPEISKSSDHKNIAIAKCQDSRKV